MIYATPKQKSPVLEKMSDLEIHELIIKIIERRGFSDNHKLPMIHIFLANSIQILRLRPRGNFYVIKLSKVENYFTCFVFVDSNI